MVPDKLFYKIGEVSRITGIESPVLRYWESEFKFLKPQKSKSGQRLYRKEDIGLILQVKRLLYEEGYTIAGARRYLLESRKKKGLPQNKKGEDPAFQVLRKVRQELENIADFLNQRGG